MRMPPQDETMHHFKDLFSFLENTKVKSNFSYTSIHLTCTFSTFETSCRVRIVVLISARIC